MRGILLAVRILFYVQRVVLQASIIQLLQQLWVRSAHFPIRWGLVGAVLEHLIILWSHYPELRIPVLQFVARAHFQLA
ncbi:hypothetical protein D3C72_1996910 [compost metagenome]